jgi:hypothetical protein
MPHDVCLGDAVQQQNWPTVATVPHTNHRLAGINHGLLKSFKHPACSTSGFGAPTVRELTQRT